MLRKMSYGAIPKELVGDIPYFLLANQFGWTKEQIDNEDCEYIEKMLIFVRGLIESSKDAKTMHDLQSMMSPMGRR